MFFKITQYMTPIVHQNKETLFQLLNLPNKPTNSPYSTNVKRKDTQKNLLTKSSIHKKFFSSESCKGGKNEENLSVVLHGPKDLKLENRPVPKITSSQVLLKIESCGISKADIHLFEKAKLGLCALNDPIVLGHQASGTILECGECVKDLKPGDKVAVEPQVPCRTCPLCKAGKYNMCPYLLFCGIPPHDGILSRLYVHEHDFCHKIPCELDYDLAALMTPLSVGVHVCKRAHITCGDSVLILGSGAIGLLTLSTARAFGASSVILVDTDSYKLKKAMEMGADYAINSKGVSEQEVVKKIHEILGHAPNKSVDCSGNEEAIRIGIMATDSCGTMALVGFGSHNQCLPIMDSIHKEIEIIGSLGFANDYGTAIDMVANQKVDPRPIITHHFKLEDTIKAFDMVTKKEESYIKILIHANPEWKPNDGNNC